MGKSIFRRFEQRWDSRERYGDPRELTYEPVVAEASVAIDAPQQRVWDFVTAPESLLLVSDGVVKAFRVPGTPVGGPGGQVCVVQEHAGAVTVQLVEVSSADAPNMLAARWLTSAGGLVERTVLTALDGSRTTLTLQLELIVPFGEGLSAHPDLQGHVDSTVRRMRSVLESGARFVWETSPRGAKGSAGARTTEGCEAEPA